MHFKESSQEVQNSQLRCTRSVSFCYNHFRICSRTPISWNPTTKSFYHTTTSTLWFLANTIILGGLSGGAAVFILLNSSLYGKVLVMLSVVFFFCICMVLAYSWITYVYYDDLIVSFSAMQRLLEEIELLNISTKIEKDLQKLDNEWKYMDIFMKLEILSLVPMKWIMPPFLVYYNLDPCYGLHVYYQWSHSGLEIAARFVIVQIGFVIGLQIIGITMSLMFLWLEMQSKFLVRLGGLAEAPQCEKFFKWYSKFYIMCKVGEA